MRFNFRALLDRPDVWVFCERTTFAAIKENDNFCQKVMKKLDAELEARKMPMIGNKNVRLIQVEGMPKDELFVFQYKGNQFKIKGIRNVLNA